MEFTNVTAAEFDTLEGVDDWRFVLGAIRADFHAGSFPAAADLVAAFTAASERAVHHPDLDVRYPGRVRVTLVTHETGGLTTLDTDLARRLSQIAAEHGATAEPERGQAVEITIDVLELDACRPFWAAVMGDYRQVGERLLVDPLRVGPAICFQQMDVPRAGRNRIHIDVSVTHDAAEERVAAALAAGGTLVSDMRARAFWVLADPEGNEACVCTWQDR